MGTETGAANDVGRQKAQEAVDAYVEAYTFLNWMIAGTVHDGHHPPTMVRELAERWPGFLEHRIAHSAQSFDITTDFEHWVLASLPGHEQAWWPAVQLQGSMDRRVQQAYECAHAITRVEGSPQRYSCYEEWKQRVWTSTSEAPPPRPTPLPAFPLPALIKGHYHCGSDSTIQGLREVIAKNTFGPTHDSPWPTARLNRGDSKGRVELRPLILDEQPLIPTDEFESWQQTMWRQREELSDLDVDTLDALNAIWLQQAESENHGAIATVDAILALRGLQPKKGGRGTRGGFEREQRVETMRTLGHLQNVWVTMAAVQTYELNPNGKRKKMTRVMQSRAFVITDRSGQLRFDGYMDVDAFMFRPGDVLAHVLFGPGRQTALMSAMALKFNPHTQTWEKRLTRYLSWQWRCRARQENYKQPFKVVTLLQAVGNPTDMTRPTRTRERLEKALDTLQENFVIAGWQYDRWNEEDANKKGWFPIWQRATLLITPPDIILEYYKGIERRQHKPKALPPILGEQLEHRRRQLGLSQSQAAAQLGISQPYWSLIVKGKKDVNTLNPSVRAKLDTWLNELGEPVPIPQ